MYVCMMYACTRHFLSMSEQTTFIHFLYHFITSTCHIIKNFHTYTAIILGSLFYDTYDTNRKIKYSSSILFKYNEVTENNVLVSFNHPTILDAPRNARYPAVISIGRLLTVENSSAVA